MKFNTNMYDNPLYSFVDVSGKVLGQVCRTKQGALTVVDNAGSVLQTSPVCFRLSAWFRFEAKFVTDGSTGSMVVHIDGQEVLNVTGINTSIGGSTDHITFNNPRFDTDVCYWDDIVWWDDVGEINNDFFGDLRIDELLPTANGASQDWVPNTGSAYAAVDDPVGSYDNDTTYIASSAADARSNFAMSDIATPSDKICAVQVRARVKKSDAGATTLSTYISSGDESVDDATPHTPTTAYLFIAGDVHETDPSTGLPWDNDGVNGLSAGVVVSS